VHVIYGSASGLSASATRTDQFWTQDTSGIADTAESGDNFGFSLIAADFNNDNFDDLAIAAPFDDINAQSDAGAVHVIYGSASGLSAFNTRPDQFWTQDTNGIANSAEQNDLFGYTLSSGDFNNDGFEDLAIGVRESLSGTNEGAVHVIYGSASGLHKSLTRSDQFWTEDTNGIAETAEDFDWFSRSLSTGDFNNDGFDDLVVGIPFENLSGSDQGGAHIIYGSASGLHKNLGRADQFWTQDTPGIAETAEDSDRFGESTTVGDFNNDGFDDLALSASREKPKLSPLSAVSAIPEVSCVQN